MGLRPAAHAEPAAGGAGDAGGPGGARARPSHDASSADAVPADQNLQRLRAPG